MFFAEVKKRKGVLRMRALKIFYIVLVLFVGFGLFAQKAEAQKTPVPYHGGGSQGGYHGSYHGGYHGGYHGYHGYGFYYPYYYRPYWGFYGYGWGYPYYGYGYGYGYPYA